MTQVKFPAKEKANVTRPCLVAACRGNENIADLLNFLIFMAHEQKVEASDVTLQLLHSEMLNRPKNEGKRFNFSERSLIGYLHRLDEWKLVTTGKYGRSQVVHIDAINAAIANPPTKPRGKPRGKRKSGNVEATKSSTKRSTSLSQKNVELELKVEMLQEKVDLLQLKVEMFQDFVEMFQLSKSREIAPQADAKAKNASVYSIDTIYSIDFFTGAYFRVDKAEDCTPSEEKKSDILPPTGTPATLSYSQEPQKDVLPSVAWLQENVPATIDSPQPPSQQSVVVTQVAPPIAEPATSLFPVAEQKPPKQYNIPTNLTAGLNERSVRELTPAQRRTMEAAEKSYNEAQAKKRKEEIWLLYGKLTGSKAIRDLWSEKAVKALQEGEATDEQITQTFTWLKSKKMSTTLSYIASNLNSCTASTPPPEKQKSIDERLAESERAQKQVEAELATKKAARLAREAQERMAVAQ